ncbi:type II secretion system protein GspG, partial [bacterium]|nr:type II secretion system protein GspG [bacterium]
LDMGGYIGLCNYDMIDGSLAYTDSVSSTPEKFNQSSETGKTFFTGFTNLAGFQAAWDGPYTTYQPDGTYSATQGSLATYDTGIGDWASGDFPTGTPLDPWNHPYGLAYSTSEEVMVVYSAGPDGKFQTEAGAVVKGDANRDGDNTDAGDYPGTTNTASDDLLYKFK